VVRVCKPPQMLTFQPNVIRDSNPHSRINADPGVCRSLPKSCAFITLSASFIFPSFIKIGQWLYAVNLLNDPLFCSDEENWKVICSPYLQPEPHQKLSSSDWWAQSWHQVSMKSAHYFISNPAHRRTQRQTDRQNDHITSANKAETWPGLLQRPLLVLCKSVIKRLTLL